MSPPLVEIAAVLGLSWICWKLLARVVLKSPLDNLPGPENPSFLQGNMGELMHTWEFQDKLGDQYTSVCKLHDMFGGRAVWVRDPRALQSIFGREQDWYEEANWFIKWNRVCFGYGLLSTLGAHHRKQRKLLNPVFLATNHLRRMTPILYGVTDRLGEAIAMQLKGGKQELNIHNWMSRATTELIGQAGLGYSFDPLIEDARDEFGDAIKRMMPALHSIVVFQLLTTPLLTVGPSWFRRWLVDIIPSAKIQDIKYLIDTLDRQSRAVLRSKKAALEKGDEALLQQVGEGKDLLSIMLRANMESAAEDRLDDEELIGQMNTLVFAATDTTSNSLSRILYLLSEHQDAQEKLRAEIIQASEGAHIPYDQLIELPYMDAIIRETLRLYPPAPAILRETRKDLVLPLSRPVQGVDGSQIEEIVVPNNTSIVISIRQCNTNKELWGEDAREWKPERWLSPLPNALTEARMPGVFGNMMTFAGGARSCIGFKMSQLETKVVLSMLLPKFKFTLSEKKIVWNCAGVAYPSVGEFSIHPALPLIVEPISSNEKN